MEFLNMTLALKKNISQLNLRIFNTIHVYQTIFWLQYMFLVSLQKDLK